MKIPRTASVMSFGVVSVAILIATLLASVCFSDIPVGYDAYGVWENWSRARLGVVPGLASSYDRSGGNADYSHYESPSGLITQEVGATVKTIEGPGVIYRFWMPHVMARRQFVVQMYFDGEPTPRIDTDSATIMDSSFSYFADPFITTCAGGQICYEPIPFSKSLRIETINKKLNTWYNRHYYQYSYLTFPSDTVIESYTGGLSVEDQQSRLAAASIFENLGQHPAGDSNTAELATTGTTLIPASGCLSFTLFGPGIIRQLNVRMDEANDVELEGLQLRVYYDGSEAAAIDASVAHFFGAGNQRAAYRSIPIGTDSIDPNDGFYCYWPMPFGESVRVEFCNTTEGTISVDAVKIEYEPGEIDDEMCYLYAQTNTTIKESVQIYHNILSTSGCGHYVGDLLYCKQETNSFWMLEGDDVITVDGEVILNGTGLEDTYNGGAYYNWVVVQPDEPEGEYPQSATRPLSGILYVNREEGLSRADQYRWRIADCVPFSNSIEVNVENQYAITGSEWTSVAFWYQYQCVDADFDNNCRIDFKDYAVFASYWLRSNCDDPDWCGGADFDNTGKVDGQDLAHLVENWP